MLELDGVVKRYRGASEEVRAVEDLTLSLSAGEMVAVHGPSGSGKTTLLLMIASLLQPDSGTIRFDGRDLAALSEQQISEYRLRDIGLIYQRFRLMPRASALENASRKLLVGGVGMSEARARAKPWLERVGLGQRLNHTPSEMSGGERQRVAIARVLACEPRLILADEPTGNLDSTRGREILQLLSVIAHERSAAVLLVTHDLAALEIADRSYTLRDGRLADDASTTSESEADEIPHATGTWR
jgi:putative ABC transport system ATP-binding protein